MREREEGRNRRILKEDLLLTRHGSEMGEACGTCEGKK